MKKLQAIFLSLLPVSCFCGEPSLLISADLCNGITELNATRDAGNLTSYGYPDTLEINADCTWKITAQPGFLIRFQLFVGSFTRERNLQYLNHLTISDSAFDLVKDPDDFFNGTFFTLSNIGYVRYSTVHSPDTNYKPKGFMIKYGEVSISSPPNIEQRYDPSGIIESKGYPVYYDFNLLQAWQVNVSPGKVIRFHLSTASLQLPGSDRPYMDDCFDNVAFYDGPSTASKLLLRTCLSNYETDVTTTSESGFVVFTSDNKDMGNGYPHGFEMFYDEIDNTTRGPCSKIQELPLKPGAFGYITNDYFPTLAPENNSHCGWLITANSDSRISFDLSRGVHLANSGGSCFANVTIYDGGSTSNQVLIRTCTSTTATVLTSSNVALVMFDSLESSDARLENDNMTMPGFVLKYWEEYPPCQDEPVQLNASSGVIQTAGYPDIHNTDGRVCSWQVTVDVGQAIRFSVSIGSIFENIVCDDDGFFDHLSIKSGVVSEFYSVAGYTEAVFSTEFNMATVNFFEHGPEYRSKEVVGYPRGFRLSYETVTEAKSKLPCQEIRRITMQNVNTVGLITNDYYPDTYEKNSDCGWLVEVPPQFTILFTFERVSLLMNGCQDYVLIHDGNSTLDPVLNKYCSIACHPCRVDVGFYPIQFEYYTTSNTGLIYLHSNDDDKEDFVGFSITYRAIAPLKPACRRVIDVDATTDGSMVGVVQSDGYPDAYDANSRCFWRIIAPVDYVFQFSITGNVANSQTFALRDGYNLGCGPLMTSRSDYGSLNQTGWSYTNVITIYFTADLETMPIDAYPRGFQLNYRAVPNHVPPHTDPDLLGLWIALGAIGAVILTVTVLIYIRLQKKNRQSFSSPIVAYRPQYDYGAAE